MYIAKHEHHHLHSLVSRQLADHGLGHTALEGGNGLVTLDQAAAGQAGARHTSHGHSSTVKIVVTGTQAGLDGGGGRGHSSAGTHTNTRVLPMRVRARCQGMSLVCLLAGCSGVTGSDRLEGKHITTVKQKQQECRQQDGQQSVSIGCVVE